MDRKKVAVSCSMKPGLIDLVEANGEGKSFSAKVEYLLEAYLKQRGILVVYDCEDSRETGEPRQLQENVERLYAYACFQKGWSDLGEALRKKYHLPEPIGAEMEVVQKLSQAGYLVQVVNDPEHDIYLDIWVAEKGKSTTCSACSIGEKMSRIREVLDGEVK